MPVAAIFKRLTHRRVQLRFFSGVALFCLLATAVLTTQVFLKLDHYGSAQNDNIQWTVTQLEVDHAKLTNAVENLKNVTEARLKILKVQVDVFYSRAHTLYDATTYRKALSGSVAEVLLEQVITDIDAMLGIVDLGDANIIIKRNQLRDIVRTMAGPVRKLSTQGMVISAERAQVERVWLTRNLIKMIVLSLVLLIALLSILALFWQLYRRYRSRAMENRTTLNRLNTIVNTSQDAILVVCPSGQIIDGNSSANAIFTLPTSPDQTSLMISDLLFQTMDDGTNLPLTGEHLAASCSDGPNLNSYLTARDKYGREFPIELSANTAWRSGNHVCIAFIRDISQRVMAEADVRAARDKALSAERAKARFLGMISHEMRTPLNGILGALDLLEDSKLTPEQTRYTQIMQSSGQLVLNQINDALDVTQADGGRISLVHERFDLDILMDDLLQSLQAQAMTQGNTLKALRPPHPLGQVIGDKNRLHQVLLNLLSNAVKFTRNGEITIEMARLDPHDDVEFQITDTGIGIAEHDLPRIFDDFVRLEDPNVPSVDGTGLGLGIARHLVTLMDGEIGAESAHNEGSLFWVRLPLPSASDMTEAFNGPDVHPLPARALNVLVVEDNVTSSFVLSEMLRKDGHAVELTSNGADGVSAAAQQAFDLILMDINMPGMDGIEATHLIRSSQGPSADARIVALTAYFRPEHNERLRNTRIDAIFTKPLRRAALRDIIAGGIINDAIATAVTGVDTQVLDQLCAVLPKQNLANILDGFMAEGSRFIKNIPDLTRAPSDQQVADLHHFAGSAATFGAVALQTALCRAEAAVLRLDQNAFKAELSALPALWQATMDEIADRRRAA